jgi:[ribosomal protein S5]-alanine N-acetyltransferase
LSWLPPVLETPRLILRSLAAEPGEKPASLDQPDNLPGLPSQWSLIDRDTGVVIGTVGFIQWDRDRNSAEVGFMIVPSRRRSGLMSEAISAVIAFGFQSLRLEEIIACVQPSNLPSIRLLEKLGFIADGMVVKPLHSKGEPQELVRLKILSHP